MEWHNVSYAVLRRTSRRMCDLVMHDNAIGIDNLKELEQAASFALWYRLQT